MQSSPSPSAATGLPPGRVSLCVGFGLAGFAIWIFPYVLAPAAIVFGAIAWRKGEPLGKWVIVAAVVCFGLGLLIAALPNDFVS